MRSDEASAPIDPDVKLPAAVLAQIQRTEAIVAAARGLEASQEASEAEGQPETSGENPPQQEQKDEAALVKIASATHKQSRREAKPREAVPDPVESKPETKADDQSEHKYNSMKGRFEQAQADIRRMSENQRNMEALLAEFSSAKAPQAQEAPKSLLSPEDIEAYGKDFLDVVGRKAQEVSQSELYTLKSELAALKAQLGHQSQVSAVSAQEKMYATMDEELPEWRELNDNKDFISWLALPDAYSGAIRHGLINQAVQQANASRVLAFFRGFLANGATTVPPGNKPEQASRGSSPRNGGPSNGQQGKLSLETLAAPGRAKGPAASTQGAPEQKLSLTRAEIAEFYQDVRAGKYDGRVQEKNRLEGFIFQAQQEGRIT